MFIAIYDQTYGSLRLSSRLLEDCIMKEMLDEMEIVTKLMQENGSWDERSETARGLQEVMSCLDQAPEAFFMEKAPESLEGNARKVMLPGSKGLNIRSNNEEFLVEDVFYSPHFKGLAYRGQSHQRSSGQNGDVKTILPIASLVEIPGESICGLYNPETGELTTA